MNEAQEDQTRAEWTKFGVLAGVLFVVVLVVAVVRPLIFGRIVPVVMGDGLSLPTPPFAELPPSKPTETPDTGTAVLAPTAEPVPVPTATPVIHTVQPGETINAIARQYDVAVADIIAANNLANPNLIKAGDTLIIPLP
ncbi:MAG: LysM peptidoglycan-binding domain-containing protein [Anaerolineae bacterium]